jgi:hypothetical protein
MDTLLITLLTTTFILSSLKWIILMFFDSKRNNKNFKNDTHTF